MLKIKDTDKNLKSNMTKTNCYIQGKLHKATINTRVVQHPQVNQHNTPP